MSRGRLSALFTWRSAARCDESGLTSTQHHAALTVSLFMSEHGDSAFPSVATLAAISGLAESTVRTALRELERKGWLTIELNRGRGHTNRYIADIPDVNPPAAGGIRSGDESFHNASRDAHTDAQEHGDRDASPSTGDHETHRLPVGLPEAKPTGRQGENHRETELNPPGAGAEYVIPRHDSGSTRASRDAAAADQELGFRLAAINVVGADLIRALNDPARAEAWLRLAQDEAETNLAGYFLKGMATGAMPSPRGKAAVAPIVRQRRTITQLIENLGPVDGAEEARHLVDEVWDLLASPERAELHELIDELISAQLPEAQPAVVASEADVA